jgi:hypothetical protein
MTLTRRLHESPAAKLSGVVRRTTLAGAALVGAVALCTVAAAVVALAIGAPPEIGLLAGLGAWRLLRARGA